MPLPEPTARRVQAPKRAGVGLRFHPRTAQPGWPEDWWQRDCDDPDVDEPDPPCLTERQMRLPEPPQ